MASDFIKEKIKDKPVNKKKLFTKFLTTVFMAVVFGVVAAICFYFTTKGIEVVRGGDLPDEIDLSTEEEKISDNITESENSPETLPEEAEEEEKTEVREEKSEERKTVINNITNKLQMTPESYEKLYASLHETAKEAERAIVTVTGSVSNTDWFDNTYENSNNGAGLIIAENGKELLILTSKSITDGAEKVSVSFVNGETVEARIVKADDNTDLETVGVNLNDINEETMNAIATAKLGNSSYSSLVGTPVIAIGNPLGIKGSEAYGLITSNTYEEQMTDMNSHLITTDIYGSSSASGVIINYSGSVMGVITTQYASDDTENIITAYSISDMKNLIERLVNGKDSIYMGIYGIDVTKDASENYNVPTGAYVTGTIAGSPAMTAGIQSGDVIVKMGDTEIKNFGDYTKALGELKAEEEVTITVQRFSRGDYQEMTFEAETAVKE